MLIDNRMSHASSTARSTSPLLYHLFKGRAPPECTAAVPCCLLQRHHSTADDDMAATADDGAAAIIKAPPPQPSRELAHVRYFIDGSVDAGVQGKVGITQHGSYKPFVLTHCVCLSSLWNS